MDGNITIETLVYAFWDIGSSFVNVESKNSRVYFPILPMYLTNDGSLL